VHACYAEAKRRPQWVRYTEIPVGGAPVAGEAYSAVVERDRLGRAFEHISVDHRAVIVLRYLLDMPPEQIAETLGIPRRTVCSRLKRAMPALRAALEADTRPLTERPKPKGATR